ncbi:hypothetical protein DEJ48_02775 [Streptomyces venezuelae]|uniref:Uncharacterized protein n=1 Tax=Streptomyces venezuelae TaxID=54571 RepID=A0A5P2BRW9_STRVZ|nr:hypothetical protein DEJ48_02775 [Streptomyces venezuelae]
MGGKDNYEKDRELGEHIEEIFPGCCGLCCGGDSGRLDAVGELSQLSAAQEGAVGTVRGADGTCVSSPRWRAPVPPATP